MDKQKKIILIFTIAASILLISFIGFYSYRIYRGYGYLNITVAPSDLEYTLDKKTYVGDQNQIKLSSGKYVINFSSNLYNPQTVTVDIKKDQSQSVSVVLELKESYNQNYYSLSQEERDQIDAYDDKVAEMDVKKFLNENPLASVLPHVTDTYRIDYGFNDNTIYYELTLYKSSVNYNKDSLTTEAKKWISDQGFNPSDYTFKITEE